MKYIIKGKPHDIMEFLVLNTFWREEVLLILPKNRIGDNYIICNSQYLKKIINKHFELIESSIPSRAFESPKYDTFGNDALWAD